MSARIRTLLWALGAILVSVAVHFRWFTGFHVLSDGDWVLRFADEVRVLFDRPLAWSPGAVGGFSYSAAFYFMELAHAALSRLGFGYGVIERVEYLWPIAVLTPLGSFLLVRKTSGSDAAAFVASLAYGLNVYFLTKQQSHIYIMLANALAPFAVLAYMRAWEEKSARAVARAALALFAVSATDFRVFYMLALVLPALPLLETLASGERRPDAIIRRAGIAGAPLALALAMNAYWILGLSGAGSLSSNPILDRGLFGSHLVTTGDAVALWRGDWTDAAPVPFGENAPAYRSWWLPVAALAGAWIGRKSVRTVFFFLVALIGIFLGKQTAAPFGELYGWLFAHFPGFNAFRESSKFFVLIAIGYSVLLGDALAWAQSAFRRGTLPAAARTSVFVLVSGLSLWNAVPLVTGDVGWIFRPMPTHREYADFSASLRADDGFSRVLWLPARTPEVFESTTHPRLSASILVREEVRRFVTGDAATPFADFTDALAHGRLSTFLDLLSVRYVPVRSLDRSFENPYISEPSRRDELVRTLEALPYLRRADMDGVVVFENPDPRPHIYVTDGTDLPFEGASVRGVRSSSERPIRHDVEVPGVHGPFVLAFSERYHDGWSIVPQQAGALTGLRRIDGSTEGVEHLDGGVGLNFFRVDPAVACGRVDCAAAPDGSLTVRFSLRFLPQAWFDVGFAITLAIIASCMAVAARPRRRSPEL